MMAQEVVIRQGKTFRFNLSINKSFNAGKCIMRFSLFNFSNIDYILYRFRWR